MSDELTPEERAAFDSLPRERMPAGLEAKVVDAMRDHGFLHKRNRVVELTRTRVAAVLAASIAVIIGAYSIGLHRGDGRDVLVPSAPTASMQELGNDTRQFEEAPATAPAPAMEQKKADEVGSVSAPAAKAPASEGERSRANAPAQETKAKEAESDEPALVDKLEKQSEDAATLSAPEAVFEERSLGAHSSALSPNRAPKEESVATLSASVREVELGARKLDAPAGAKQSEIRAMSNFSERTAPSALRSDAAAGASAMKDLAHSVTLLLDGVMYSIEADSVRVVEDERGSILIIYAGDGIVRIRLIDK